MKLFIVQLMLLSLLFKSSITAAKLRSIRAASPTKKMEAIAEQDKAKNASSHHETDAERMEKISSRLLKKIEIEGHPEPDWDGHFPVGPVEDYKRTVDKGLDEENRNVIFSKLGNYSIFLSLFFFHKQTMCTLKIS